MREKVERSKKTGLPPGSLIPVEEEQRKTPRISIFEYDESHCTERDITEIDYPSVLESKKINWINIDGLSDTRLFERIGSGFNIHSLTLEDILTIDQRPKMENHEDYLYIVLKMINWDDGTADLEVEQVSLLLLRDTVLSFQEKTGDVFDPLRERLRRGTGRTRKEEADYIVYSLMDAIVDNYFNMMDKLRQEIEQIEEEVIEDPETSTSVEIHKMRNQVAMLRRSIWPLREVLATILRSESELIRSHTLPYFRDLYDHTVKVIETLEMFRDNLAGLLDIYLSSVSNKMNEVMKVLTMISTVFIPLSFLAGLYGMNFRYMPELNHRMGYPVLLLVMALLVVFFLLFFKRKKWL
ncbi:MAG: magnesium/cobalt transporter CorA [Chitinispirillaceae bacterium]|nr:magnesium/cobalt transporter CorA [Chitinispirillaceae bacterium]